MRSRSRICSCAARASPLMQSRLNSCNFAVALLVSSSTKHRERGETRHVVDDGEDVMCVSCWRERRHNKHARFHGSERPLCIGMLSLIWRKACYCESQHNDAHSTSVFRYDAPAVILTLRAFGRQRSSGALQLANEQRAGASSSGRKVRRMRALSIGCSGKFHWKDVALLKALRVSPVL